MWSWVRLAAGGVVYALAVVWAAVLLPPDGVPLHLGANGLADRIGARSEWLTSAVTLGVVVLLIGAGSVTLVRWGSLRWTNVPYKQYWTAPERRDRLRRMLATDVSGLLGATLAFLAHVPLGSVLALRSAPPGVPPAVMWSVVAAYLVSLAGWCGWMVRYRYRPPRPPGSS